MLPVASQVQPNVLVHLEATITGHGHCYIGTEPKISVETNGIIIKFSTRRIF